MTNTTHNPYDETCRVSRLRENLTSGSDGEGLETGRYTVPRQSFTRQLFFRHIKTTMGMEMLRCKTPRMVRKELRMFIIAHNLIRALMQEAASLYQCDLTRLSFKATVDTLRQFSYAIHATKDIPRTRARVLNEMLLIIASEKVPLREHRSEPRALKRRPKPFQRLMCHRKDFKVSKSRRNQGKANAKTVVSAP